MLKSFLKFIIDLYYNIYTSTKLNRLYYKAKKIKRSIYSYWISHKFKCVGHNCMFYSFLKLREPHNISFGNNCSIGFHTVIELYSDYKGQQNFHPTLTFGNNSSLGDYSHISCINNISIGNNVRMGRKVFITDNAHGTSTLDIINLPPNHRPLSSNGPIIIEDNVWIGEMVCIMPGVTIGKCSIIGANAVVTKNIPAYSVVGGVPAKVIKYIK